MKKPKLAGSLVINDRVPELGTRLVRFSWFQWSWIVGSFGTWILFFHILKRKDDHHMILFFAFHELSNFNWLVVLEPWNFERLSHHIGNHHPNWLSFFSEG
jgi:hypothetical protein